MRMYVLPTASFLARLPSSGSSRGMWLYSTLTSLFCSAGHTAVTVSFPVEAESHASAAEVSESVADNPIRLAHLPVTLSILSRQHSSCIPLSESMKACTSSIITNLRSPNSLLVSSGSPYTRPCNDSGVICSIPEGSFLRRSFIPTSDSPCQLVSWMSESLSTSVSLPNWSSISALSGLMYSAPIPFGGSSWSEAMTGNIAASVFPLLVPEDSRRWLSEPNITSNARSWMSLNSVHLLVCMYSLRNGGSPEK